MKPFLTQIAIAWGFLVIFFLFYTDFALPKLIQISDYLMTFHTAGYLVVHGKAADLYPPLGATSFAGMPFDKAAHQILKYMPAPSTAEYLYMPLSAWVFALFSCLDSPLSLSAWQAVSLVCLGLSAFLIWRAASKTGFASSYRTEIGWFSLSFLPVAMTLWIGQVGIVFGLAPLCAGYFLILTGRPFLSGLVWAVAIFKPQFLVAPLMVALSECIQGRWKTLLGLATSICSILILNVVIFSPQTFSSWMNCLAVSDIVYSNLKSGVAAHIATSLPRTLILLCPPDKLALFKPFIYAIAALLALAGVWQVYKVARSEQDRVIKISLTMVIAFFATPLIVPHLFFYDLCVLTVAGMIIFCIRWNSVISLRLRLLARVAWLCVNAYGLTLLVNKKYTYPLLLVILMVVFYQRVLDAARISYAMPE